MRDQRGRTTLARAVTPSTLVDAGRIHPDTDPAMSKISSGRKASYYVGTALMAVGLAMFLSTFVIDLIGFGDFSDFNARIRQSSFLAFGGVVLILIGGGIRRVSARGVAGSGLTLDPERAREDLQPYAKMAGGLLKDAVDELRPGAAQAPGGAGAQVIRVRCGKCRALNAESAKFCDQCGGPL